MLLEESEKNGDQEATKDEQKEVAKDEQKEEKKVSYLFVYHSSSL